LQNTLLDLQEKIEELNDAIEMALDQLDEIFPPKRTPAMAAGPFPSFKEEEEDEGEDEGEGKQGKEEKEEKEEGEEVVQL